MGTAAAIVTAMDPGIATVADRRRIFRPGIRHRLPVGRIIRSTPRPQLRQLDAGLLDDDRVLGQLPLHVRGQVVRRGAGALMA